MNCFGLNQQDSRPQKLIDVQRQIDEHGRNGGWSDRDHADFLKLYTQIASDKELLHRLSEVMPQYTLSELREHLEWFDHHERLWEYKRKIIAEWKQEKQQQKQRNTLKVSTKYKETDDQTDSEQQQQRRKQLEMEQKRKKQMVREWREQKEQEEEEEMRKKQEALKKKQSRQQRAYRERVREQKRLLLELQERRKLNELVKKTKEGQNKHLKGVQKAERNKKLLRKFRTKDMLLVSKKKEAICKKQQEERDREWRMVNLIAKSQPDIQVKEDRDRLLKPTTATKKRVELKKKEKESGSHNKECTALFDGVMTAGNTTRSVPTWRRGL